MVTVKEGGRATRKNWETQKRDGKQNSLLSCNQSLFGGSATGSWSNVVRIERARDENKQERKEWQGSRCVMENGHSNHSRHTCSYRLRFKSPPRVPSCGCACSGLSNHCYRKWSVTLLPVFTANNIKETMLTHFHWCQGIQRRRKALKKLASFN